MNNEETDKLDGKEIVSKGIAHNIDHIRKKIACSPEGVGIAQSKEEDLFLAYFVRMKEHKSVLFLNNYKTKHKMKITLVERD